MTLNRCPRHFGKSLLLGVCSIGSIFTIAQADSESESTGVHFDQTDQFTILSELEVQSYQKERYEKIKAELNDSPLTLEHQELIAHALGNSVVGAPVSSYRQESFTEGTDVDRTKEIQTLSILDTGMIEEEETIAHSLNGAMTPFSHIAFVPLDPASGQKLAESDSNVTFRFDVDIAIPEDEEMPKFVLNMIRDLKLVADFTIDKDNRSLQSTSIELLKPLRKLFLFKFKTFKITDDYEFNEDCGCIAMSNRNINMEGSVIFMGRFFMRASVIYSDIECEKPLRFLHQESDASDDIFTFMF